MSQTLLDELKQPKAATDTPQYLGKFLELKDKKWGFAVNENATHILLASLYIVFEPPKKGDVIGLHYHRPKLQYLCVKEPAIKVDVIDVLDDKKAPSFLDKNIYKIWKSYIINHVVQEAPKAA